MGTVNDPNRYARKFERAKALLNKADIDEEDRRAVMSFIESKETTGKYEYSTLESYCTVLRRAAELAHSPLTEWSVKNPAAEHKEADYQTFLRGINNGTLDGAKAGGYSSEYRRSFRQILRPFFRFLGREWAEDIEIGQPTAGRITEMDCFTSGETGSLFAVADVRDSAILALWLATGQRATAIASLKLVDVELGKRSGRVRLNPEAIGLKGAEGWRPMIWATPYVERYVNENHPRRDDSDAPLFCVKRNGGHYAVGDPLSYDALDTMLKSLCERSEINPAKAQTHRLRHTAIRRMIRDGLHEQQIKYMVGWHGDSSQLERYGTLRDKTHASDIEEHYGLDEDDEREGEYLGLQFDNCPDCGMRLSALTDPAFCPDCGLPLKHSSKLTERKVQ